MQGPILRLFHWLLLTTLLAVATESALAGTLVQLPAEADTTAVQDEPDSNFGAEPTLLAQPGIPAANSYLRFDLSSIPSGALIHQAHLELFDFSSQDVAIDACVLAEPWAEGGLTWTKRPAEGQCFDSRLVIASSPLVWDVAGVLQDWVDGAVPNDGVVFRAQSGGADLVLCQCQDAQSQQLCSTVDCKDLVALTMTCEALCANHGGSLNSQCSAGSQQCGVGFLSTWSREGQLPPTLSVDYTVCGNGQIEDPETCDPPYSQGGDASCTDACLTNGNPQELALNQLRKASTTPVTLRFEGPIPAFVSTSVQIPNTFPDDPVVHALDFVKTFNGLYRVPNGVEGLYLDRILDNEQGDRDLFFGQQHNSLPVLGSSLAVHVEGDRITSTSGRYLRELPAEAPIPQVNRENAEQIALSQTPGTGLIVVGTTRLAYFNATLHAGSDDTTYLSWRVTVHGHDPALGSAGTWTVVVDAVSGNLLDLLNLTRTHTLPKQYDIQTGDHINPPLCWDFSFRNETWFDEAGAVSAYPGLPVDDNLDALNIFSRLNLTYDYYENIHHLHSWDGVGGNVEVMAHTGDDWNNASYSSFCNHMRFGDQQPDLGGLAHEFTHGIDRFGPNLRYENQSGALDESYADIAEALVDDDDWLLGEDLPGMPACGALRDMANPPNCNDPDHMSSFVVTSGDNGGVHTNSGIHNKVFYMVANGDTHPISGVPVEGIGRFKAGKIFHETHIRRVGGNATFTDARDATIEHARWFRRSNMHGITNSNVCSVINAFGAVGIGDTDIDCDGVLDSPDSDDDGDGIPDSADRCPLNFDPDEVDTDSDGTPDACDFDDDNDGILDDGDGSRVSGDAPCTGGANTSCDDNCPVVANFSQFDPDADGRGEVCDDDDGDGRVNSDDNCPMIFNDQANVDGDALGDLCDPDADDDQICNVGGPLSGGVPGVPMEGCSAGPMGTDNCPLVDNFTQPDADSDDVGDDCDLCVDDPDPTNNDADDDGIGDICDDDRDGDGIGNLSDSCPDDADPMDIDIDGNGLGLVCDPEENGIFSGSDRADLFGLLRFTDLTQTLRIPIFPCLTGCPDHASADSRTQVTLGLPPAGVTARLVDDEGFTVSHSRLAESTQLQTVTAPEFFYRLPDAVIEGRPVQQNALVGPTEPGFRAHDYFLELRPGPDIVPGLDYPVRFQVFSYRGSELCGDANDDDRFDSADPAFLRQVLTGLQAASNAFDQKCPVIETGGAPCSLIDAVVMLRELAFAGLAPGIAQVCPAAGS